MKKIETDVVVVGSGAGGATVAKELAGAGEGDLVTRHVHAPECDDGIV
jgi:ribulose 1,5-bisphosphate synthetase/thiazole synthase